MCARTYAVNAMSHGASTVTKATRGAAKGGLSQAEVWEKVSAIQKGLSGFRVQFDSLEKALRTHVPSTVMGPDDVDFASACAGLAGVGWSAAAALDGYL